MIERIWLDIAFMGIVFNNYKFKDEFCTVFQNWSPSLMHAEHKSLNYKVKKKNDFNI